jgi:hypothetical protein
MTEDLDAPLRKRAKMEFPHPSNSLYALVNVSMEHTHQQPEEASNSQVHFVTRCPSIPGVSSILQSVDAQPFPPIAQPSTNAALSKERTPFTPFLLPNPNSYYNPLNPPRTVGAVFPPAPLYSPQYSTEPSLSSGPEVQSRTKASLGFQQLASQGEGMSASTVHFPLSDSPSKVWAKRSNERTPKSNTSTDVIGSGPPLVTTDNASTTNRFILVEQPNDIQRKSYKKENRCLLPNPLIVCLKELTDDQKKDPPVVLDGVVSLKLVNNDGSELPPHKQNPLESIEGGLTHPLGDDHTTCFSVKVLQTSEGNLFRLIFNISYRLKGQGRVEEQIISRPFAVYSNKHNRNSRKKQKKDGAIP